MVELTPETRITWWNRELKELWQPRIRRAAQLYNNAEIATFVAGMRDIYIYHINSMRFEDSYTFLRENKLSFYPTNKSAIYQGFSHKHLPPQPNEPFTLYGACVRQGEEDIGRRFVEMNNASPTDHRGIGKLLGYPDCCVEFFMENWGKPSIDPIYEAAVNTASAEQDAIHHVVELHCHPYCNNMLRYFGLRITPHLTCSMQCEATIKQGEEWFEIMEQLDAEAAEWAKTLLSMPLTWNCYRGVAIIDTPIFRGITNSDVKKTIHQVKNLGWET